MELEENEVEPGSESCACLLREQRGGHVGWQAGSGRGTPGHGPVAFLQSPPKLRKSQADPSSLRRVGQEHLRGQRNEVDGGGVSI